MAWVYLEALHDWPLFEWPNPSPWGTHIWIHGNRFYFNTPHLSEYIYTTRVPKIKQWNKLAMSWNFSTGHIEMYVNGHRELFVRRFGAALQATSGPVSIGRR